GKATQFVGVVQDITERKEIEQRIKKSEERFRKLVQNSADVVQLVNRDGVILYVSPSVTHVLGYQPEEMVHRPSSDFIHPDDMVLIHERTQQFLQGALTIPGFQHRIKHKNGHWMWVESIAQNQLAEPGIEAILVNYHDITERKLAEDKLNNEREWFKALIQNSNDVFELVGKDMRAKYVSPAVTRLFGFSQEEFLGGLLGTRVHPDEQERVREEIEDLIQHPGKVITVEHRVHHKDGRWIWIEVTAANGFANPSVEAIILNFHRINERHEVQERENQFVLLASHQLRTPLTSVRWYGELLLGKANELPVELREYIAEIVHSNERMIHLVSSLLNVSRAERSPFSVTPTEVDVISLIKDVVKEAEVLTKKNHVTIKEHYSPSIGTMMIDRDLLFMIVSNLLSNAIKYNKEYGNVDIALTEKESMIELAISDTGPGISDEEKDKIFNKLFRTDNARLIDPDGAGLGLYIVKLILDRIGGSIVVKSTEKGSTFTVILPRIGITATEGTWRLAR
ncbi:MAG TPA: PAS domain S-box protein, partial [Patescibacteria group bacterium]|nr:PAS domain S-box protein [Patescibacteria group bacterium]